MLFWYYIFLYLIWFTKTDKKSWALLLIFFSSRGSIKECQIVNYMTNINNTCYEAYKRIFFSFRSLIITLSFWEIIIYESPFFCQVLFKKINYLSISKVIQTVHVVACTDINEFIRIMPTTHLEGTLLKSKRYIIIIWSTENLKWMNKI